MITDEVYVEIELLRRHGMSLRRIAAEVGCAVNTVCAHLAAPGLPRYERKVKRATKLAAYEAYLRERQASARPHWIALWLGHESPATTHHYVEADLTMKERALAKLHEPATTIQRYRAPDSLIGFLKSL